jgi:hypothetical protein
MRKLRTKRFAARECRAQERLEHCVFVGREVPPWRRGVIGALSSHSRNPKRRSSRAPAFRNVTRAARRLLPRPARHGRPPRSSPIRLTHHRVPDRSRRRLGDGSNGSAQPSRRAQIRNGHSLALCSFHSGHDRDRARSADLTAKAYRWRVREARPEGDGVGPGTRRCRLRECSGMSPESARGDSYSPGGVASTGSGSGKMSHVVPRVGRSPIASGCAARFRHSSCAPNQFAVDAPSFAKATAYTATVSGSRGTFAPQKRQSVAESKRSDDTVLIIGGPKVLNSRGRLRQRSGMSPERRGISADAPGPPPGGQKIALGAPGSWACQGAAVRCARMCECATRVTTYSGFGTST